MIKIFITALIPIDSWEEEEDEVNPKWYQMELFIGESFLGKSASHDDLFEACVIREAFGQLIDNFFWWNGDLKLNLTDQALVGLIVNEIDWFQLTTWDDPIPKTELEDMHFKLKIFACDDNEADYKTGG